MSTLPDGWLWWYATSGGVHPGANGLEGTDVQVSRETGVLLPPRGTGRLVWDGRHNAAPDGIDNRTVSGCFVDLYWIPVAAGTMSRFRHWSLWLYEAADAAWARRKRVALLYHSALKIGLDGEVYALEIAPVPRKQGVAPVITGPVGARFAGRLRIFRYQLACLSGTPLPDEAWAVDSPIRLSNDCATADHVLELLPAVPAHTWGRRVPGTTEMWTSDSVVSWLLIRAGIHIESIAVPSDGRAPGWRAGIELASVRQRAINEL